MCNFSEKGQKRTKYLKIWAKCTKFENILKKGSLMCATIASMKQLEYALNSESALSEEWVKLWSLVFACGEGRLQEKQAVAWGISKILVGE